MGATEPQGVANLDPRGMVGRFREEDFLKFFSTESMAANEPPDVVNFDPRGMIGKT